MYLFYRNFSKSRRAWALLKNTAVSSPVFWFFTPMKPFYYVCLFPTSKVYIQLLLLKRTWHEVVRVRHLTRVSSTSWITVDKFNLSNDSKSETFKLQSLVPNSSRLWISHFVFAILFGFFVWVFFFPKEKWLLPNSNVKVFFSFTQRRIYSR